MNHIHMNYQVCETISQRDSLESGNRVRESFPIRQGIASGNHAPILREVRHIYMYIISLKIQRFPRVREMIPLSLGNDFPEFGADSLELGKRFP